MSTLTYAILGGVIGAVVVYRMRNKKGGDDE